MYDHSEYNTGTLSNLKLKCCITLPLDRIHYKAVSSVETSNLHSSDSMVDMCSFEFVELLDVQAYLKFNLPKTNKRPIS